MNTLAVAAVCVAGLAAFCLAGHALAGHVMRLVDAHGPCPCGTYTDNPIIGQVVAP